MRFIEVTQFSGNKICVNVEKIVWISDTRGHPESDGASSQIVFFFEGGVGVKESVDEIILKIRG